MAVSRPSVVIFRSKPIRKISIVLLILISFAIFQCAIFSSNVFAGNQETDRVSNCGPAVLQKVLDIYGVKSDFSELIIATNTRMGKTTMKDMAGALIKKGFYATALEISYADLEKLLNTHTVIAHINKNAHYIIVEEIKDGNVKIYNPSLEPTERRICKEIFTAVWNGKVIAVSRKPVDLAMCGKKLTEEETIETAGGADCKNVDSDPDKNRKKGSKTSDPVQIDNGDLLLDITDMSVQSRGIPIVFERHYSAQATSIMNGWKLDKGAGPWCIEDGELSGYGDRMLHDNELADFTVEADMKTVVPGPEDYHCAWINFRYADEKNRYYFLIKKSGIIELTKFQSGKQYFLSQKQTLYNPLKWNQIKITVVGNNIKVYINGNLEIDFADTNNTVLKGRVVLESYFSNSHYDNIKILFGGTSLFYDFNIDDNNTMFGNGWTALYDMKITQMENGDLIILRDNGIKDRFVKSGTGYTAPKGVYDTLTKDLSGYLLRTKEGLVYRFDIGGTLVSITDPNGNQSSYAYSMVNQ